MDISDAYKQSLRLCLELHLVDLESDEAERIRDECDLYWYSLTETEEENVGKLSEFLYTILED